MMKYIADRSVDELGRIILPTQIREIFDIKPGNKLSIYADEEKVILKTGRSVCRLCGSEKIENEDLMICADCIRKIKSI